MNCQACTVQDSHVSRNEKAGEGVRLKTPVVVGGDRLLGPCLLKLSLAFGEGPLELTPSCEILGELLKVLSKPKPL